MVALIRGPRPSQEHSLAQPVSRPGAQEAPVRGRWRSGVVHRCREDVSAAMTFGQTYFGHNLI